MQANAEHLKRAAAGSLANFEAGTVSARGHNLFLDSLRGQAKTTELDEELAGSRVDEEEAGGGFEDAKPGKGPVAKKGKAKKPQS